MNNKVKLGQFFTQKNIFSLVGFQAWWKIIPNEKKQCVLEPFAGANNIIKSLQDINLIKEYMSYDIEPQSETVQKQNTLQNFPKGFGCVVTNPPYLSKNSASKKQFKINFPNGFYDLYEVALQKCLNNVDYVAAIIPESFITSPRLKERLHSVISLTYNDMFFDTEHPVCLAMFVPNKTHNFDIYQNEQLVGTFNELRKKRDVLLNEKNDEIKIQFNTPDGTIHLVAVDNNKNGTGIFFSDENIVAREEIKVSSRARTRINIWSNNQLIKDPKTIKDIVLHANKILQNYREETNDVFMTSFKGMRSDGKYRRRLDFATAKEILLMAIKNSREN